MKFFEIYPASLELIPTNMRRLDYLLLVLSIKLIEMCAIAHKIILTPKYQY